MGWYTLASAEGNPDDFKVVKATPTGLNTERSIQHNWIVEHLAKLNGLASASMSELDILKPWIPATFNKFMYVLKRSSGFRRMDIDQVF